MYCIVLLMCRRRWERPYQHDSTASRPLSEVKHVRAWLVLRWGTTLESQVLFSFSVTNLALFCPSGYRSSLNLKLYSLPDHHRRFVDALFSSAVVTRTADEMTTRTHIAIGEAGQTLFYSKVQYLRIVANIFTYYYFYSGYVYLDHTSTGYGYTLMFLLHNG